ncbi:hypothetical protein [Vibrio cyclitrophicus]|uniref:hypothetical protein n=1 Tax=Vibrio cyclitrophicus TaxID=47951 RepID=UPI000C836287|nr:hypothetical protein [Vibrio cyclitrophicus]PMF43163.1 hypothetical protein BCV14_19930 [Vibrio cyclitrophicus]
MASTQAPEVSKLIKWLFYTVLIGLTPIGLRLFVSSFVQDVEPINPADFIAVGFVLHISIFNELEHMSGDQTWKTVSNVGSLVAIFFYGALSLALLFVESGYDGINVEVLTNSSITLAVCSFILCFIIFFRLSSRAKSALQTGREATC